MLLLKLLLCLLGLPATATTVEVATPGTLENCIYNLDEPSFPTLKIVGALNSDDLRYLHTATGRMKTVETLDLSEVTIVIDGKAYATAAHGDDSGFFNSYTYTFYLSNEVYEERTSFGNSMGGMNYQIAHYGNDLSGAFAQTNYKKIIMPNGFKTAGDMTFYNCASLVEVEFPAGLESVGQRAFTESDIETIDLSKVKEMKIYAFHGCANLTGGTDGVLDLSSLDYIPDFAFSYSTSLKTVKLSDNLSSIGEDAFKNSGLTAINFPNNLKEIGNSAFYQCTSITSIVLPSSLEKLGDKVFAGCSQLASVEILATSLPVSYSMFSGTPWINSLQAEDDGIIYLNTTALRYAGIGYEDIELTFREGTTDISDNFCDYSNSMRLASIKFPSTLRRIGNKAFDRNDKIIDLQFPKGLKEIGDEAFHGFTKLASVQFPSTLKNIGVSAFASCEALADLSLPNGLESIEGSAFSGCTALKTIVFPESIKSIGGYAFYGCTQLNGDVTIPEGVEKLGSGIFSNTSIWRIFYRAKNAMNTGNNGIGDVERVVIDSNVEIIPNNCFNYCPTLQQVTFEERTDDATLILGTGCFSSNSKLQSITLPKGKIVIRGAAFSECYGLETFETLGVVTEIQEDSSYGTYNGAFHYCRALTKIAFPDGLLKVGNKAFAMCENLQSVHLGNSVKYIGDSVFEGCPLTDIQFGNQLDSIGAFAFLETNLEAVDLGEHIQSIGHGAFWKCRNLQHIDIPSSVKTIGNSAFTYCSSLSSITLAEGLEEIGDELFAGCSSLKELVIPSTVKKIGNRILYDVPVTPFIMEVLESHIQDPKKVEYNDDPFFARYNKLTLRVPAGTLEAYQSTYPWSQFTKIEEIKGPEYTLTYVVDGEVYKTVQVESGKAITPEPEPTKEGYTFSGWSEIPETMPDHDVTVTGSFTVNTYTLTYIVDSEVYKTVQVEYGSAITPEPAPTKEGYTFSSWSEIPKTMPDHDVTVTGSFTVNTYTLTYIVDGEIYKTLQLEYGSAITPEPEPTKDGYIFLGWSEIPLTMPAYDVTVTGSYMIVDGIQGILVEDSDYQIFNLNGKRVNTLQKGMNIVRMSNGTVLKVHVK